jgi:hypothetical protein
MSQISMFIAQSGPISMSLVARSTIEFTISAHHQKESDPNIKPLPAPDTHFPRRNRRQIRRYNGILRRHSLSLSLYKIAKFSTFPLRNNFRFPLFFVFLFLGQRWNRKVEPTIRRHVMSWKWGNPYWRVLPLYLALADQIYQRDELFAY